MSVPGKSSRAAAAQSIAAREPLVSAVPRPQSRPCSISAPKGSCRQAEAWVTGTVSRCASRISMGPGLAPFRRPSTLPKASVSTLKPMACMRAATTAASSPFLPRRAGDPHEFPAKLDDGTGRVRQREAPRRKLPIEAGSGIQFIVHQKITHRDPGHAGPRRAAITLKEATPAFGRCVFILEAP